MVVVCCAEPWLLARTRPCHERIAETNLVRLGVETYIPRFYDRERRRKTVLFPSYAFVRIPLGVSIRGCKGVRHLVMMGERRAAAPPGLVDSYRAREVNGLVVLEEALPELRPGVRVRITSGPFADHFGLCQGLDGKGRVKLLLEAVFNRAVLTTAMQNNLEVVRETA